MPKITKRFVDTLHPNPAGSDVFVWDSGDGAVKGFGIRIKPSGAASYLIQYRNKHGRTRRLVLGRVSVLTPSEARTAAGDKLKEVAKGGDPSAERRAERKAITVGELCGIYLADAKGRIKESTLAMDRSRIDRHVRPLLGNRPVAGLTLSDIEKFQNDVAGGKTAKPRAKKGRSGLTRGGRGVAARTVGMLGTILEFARRRRIITENPARGVRKFPDSRKDRFLTPDEIGKLGKAMRAAEAEWSDQGRKIPDGIRIGHAAIRALLLTGCRRNEIAALPWEWLDVERRCIRFRDTKSGPQLRHLGKRAVEFLASQPRQEDCPWVFPASRGDGHFVGIPPALERLCARAGLVEVTVHVLRHTFASIAEDLEFSQLVVAGLLGHRLAGVTARYTHVPDNALLAAADAVSAEIANYLDGKAKNVKEENAADNLVPFPAKVATA